jgi:basic membrane protein A and related proteins
MKKIITSILLATLMLMTFILTGCSSNTEPANTVASEKQQKVKVGFIYVGPVSDEGWTYSHDEGRKLLEKELGVETIYVESVKEDLAETERVCEQLISQGCNVIVGTSFGFMDGMESSALKHPEVKYLHNSGYKTAENMSNYFGRIYEGRYLTGIIAGLTTKSNSIGYVAAFPIPEVVRGINAFTLGAKSVNPNVVVKVKWTNTWYDPAKEKEAGKALIAEGADVMAQHQNTAGPAQAAEEAGALSIGYNTDMSSKLPKSYLTSPIWHWEKYYIPQIKAVMDGTWQSSVTWNGIKEGYVDLAPLTDKVPAEAKELVEKQKQAIISGENKIFVGPIKDQQGNVKIQQGEVMSDEELLKFDWFVEGVEGKLEQ